MVPEFRGFVIGVFQNKLGKKEMRVYFSILS